MSDRDFDAEIKHDELLDELKMLRHFAGSNCIMSDYQTADQMRLAITARDQIIIARDKEIQSLNRQIRDLEHQLYNRGNF